MFKHALLRTFCLWKSNEPSTDQSQAYNKNNLRYTTTSPITWTRRSSRSCRVQCTRLTSLRKHVSKPKRPLQTATHYQANSAVMIQALWKQNDSSFTT